MLDQNTDRMWYVIGAILIGAAIVFGMSTFMPNAFASVGTTMTNVLDDALYSGPIDVDVRVGQKNADGTLDIKVFSDSEHGIESIELVNDSESITHKNVLSFDGDDDYLDMRYEFGQVSSFSIGAWINDVGTQQFLINHDTGGGWSMTTNGGIKVNTDTSAWRNGESNGGDLNYVNKTSHVILTWDGSMVRRYVNGELVMDGPDIQGTHLLRTLFIGARANLRSEPVREPTIRTTGQILDFYVFKERALNPNEVQDIYQNGLSNNESQLVLRYDFGEQSGDTIHDKSGNDRHAKVYGATWVPMYTVKDNGTYTFKITDNEGHVREKTVTVNGL